MSSLVEIEREGRVVVLRLNAPQKRNAISIEMRRCLREELEIAISDNDVRAIILTGAGGHFCSGGDLSAAHTQVVDPDRTAANVRLLQNIIRLIAGPKPILGAVEGSAFGAGMSLAAACDFVIAGEGSRFAASFSKIGLSADAGMTWFLPQRVGVANSRRLMLGAEVISVERAFELGLVDEVTPRGQALANALEHARRISELSPLSIATIKKSFTSYPASLDEALDAELDDQVRMVSSSDYFEGRTAFLEKRPANFTGG